MLLLLLQVWRRAEPVLLQFDPAAVSQLADRAV
jgi:hypothetical protein